MRVHIFARDRNLAVARRHAVGTPEYRRSMTTAAREQRILEEVFGDTLSRSHHAWSDRQRAAVAASENPDARFVSRVAGHLITTISEAGLRFLLVSLLILLVAADLILTRSLRRQARV